MPQIEDQDIKESTAPIISDQALIQESKSELISVLTSYLIKKSKQEREAKIKGPADHHI